MSFALRTDAEKWFSNIKDQKPLNSKFDLYYFCLMLGIASGRKSNPNERSSAPEFIDYFINDYKSTQRVLLGLLLTAEFKRFSIDLTEKESVRKKLIDMIDPTSSTNLTTDAIKSLNEYASGGYEYLTEKMPTKPYKIDDFLRSYSILIKSAMSENTHWKGFEINTGVELKVKN